MAAAGRCQPRLHERLDIHPSADRPGYSRKL